MSQHCREFQLRWLDRAAPAQPVDDGALAHSLGCRACAEFVRRAARLQRAFGDLERLPVPEELPGRVVAACNPGYLQDRAAALLGAVVRLEAPRELDQHVMRTSAHRLRAPQVLERLVDEELRDPGLALVRRFAGRLHRLEAPSELLGRVQAELAAPHASTAARRERLLAVRWSILGVVVVVGLLLGIEFGTRETQAAPALTFEVRRVNDASELDAVARQLAAGLSGGWSEIPWGEAR